MAQPVRSTGLTSPIVVVMFCAAVLLWDFFSNQDPEATDTGLVFIPVQRISFLAKTG